MGTKSSELDRCDVNFQCGCKENIVGLTCDRCLDGWFGFPHCQPCECDEHGSVGPNCTNNDGICTCKEGYVGDKCATCDDADAYFFDSDLLSTSTKIIITTGEPLDVGVHTEIIGTPFNSSPYWGKNMPQREFSK